MEKFRYLEFKSTINLTNELVKAIRFLPKVNYRDKSCRMIFILDNLPSVFDLVKLNKCLDDYRVQCIRSSEINFGIVSAKYGSKIPIDITEKISKLATTKKLIILDNVNINAMFSDPEPGIPKVLQLTYKVNGYRFTETINEKNTLLEKSLIIDFTDLSKLVKEFAPVDDADLRAKIFANM